MKGGRTLKIPDFWHLTISYLVEKQDTMLSGKLLDIHMFCRFMFTPIRSSHIPCTDGLGFPAMHVLPETGDYSVNTIYRNGFYSVRNIGLA